MKQKINKGHYHEMIDRTNLIQSVIETFLIETPIGEKKFYRKRLNKIQKLLAEIYIEAGQKM